jgi:hypothetical protein
LDGAEELSGLFRCASRQKNSHHARIVKAKVYLLAIGQLHLQEVPQVPADFLKVPSAS